MNRLTRGRRRVAAIAIAGGLVLLSAPADAAAETASVVRVSSRSLFPIGDCLPDDDVIQNPPTAPPREWGDESLPTIAVNPLDPKNIATAYGADGYGIVAASSFDGGDTWRHAVVPGVTKCTGGTLSHPAWPRLAFGPDGRLYLAVSGLAAGLPAPGVSNVGVATSADGGRTWAPPVWISDVPLSARSHMIVTEPDEPGAAIVTWHSPQPTIVSYLSRTTDGGQTWVTSRLPNVAAQVQPYLTPLAARDGRLYVFFANQQAPTVVEQENTANGRPLDLYSDLLVTRSDDKGVSWSKPRAVLKGITADWVGAREGREGAIHISAWRETKTGRKDLLFIRSDRRGRTWTPPKLVAHDVVRPVPGLAIGLGRRLGITYVQQTGDALRVMFAVSIDRGKTWAQEQVPTGQLSPGVEGETTYIETVTAASGFASAFVLKGPGTDGPSDVYLARTR